MTVVPNNGRQGFAGGLDRDKKEFEAEIRRSDPNRNLSRCTYDQDEYYEPATRVAFAEWWARKYGTKPNAALAATPPDKQSAAEGAFSVGDRVRSKVLIGSTAIITEVCSLRGLKLLWDEDKSGGEWQSTTGFELIERDAHPSPSKAEPQGDWDDAKVAPWSGVMPRADYLREALSEIADCKNLTATPEQFHRHLQRMACKALTEDAMAEQPAHQEPQQPARPGAGTEFAQATDEECAEVDTALGLMTLPPIRISLELGSTLIDEAAKRGMPGQAYIRQLLESAARPGAQEPQQTGGQPVWLDDEGRAMVVNSHHYTAESVAALIADSKALESGDPDALDRHQNRDFRTHAGVLWRVISGLADGLVPEAAAPVREVWLASNKTTSAHFASKELADSFVSSMPATVAGGFNVLRIAVIGADERQQEGGNG